MPPEQNPPAFPQLDFLSPELNSLIEKSGSFLNPEKKSFLFLEGDDIVSAAEAAPVLWDFDTGG